MAKRHSIKKQWYILYFVVLIIPMLVMLLSYRFSYAKLSDAVYDRQMAHLTQVRDLVDAQAKNMSAVMLSFGSDQQIRQAVGIQDPAAENQMGLLRSILSIVGNASVNNDLVDHYTLYLPESDYLLDDAHWNPRRVLSWQGYDGTISETELEMMLNSAQTGRINLSMSRNGSLFLYTKVNVYRTNKPLYVAAVLATKELIRLMGSGTAGEEALIAIESLDGGVQLSNHAGRSAAYQANPGAWFHAEVASEVLPLRYFYASPTHIVEEKLIAYRYVLYALAAAALILGGVAIHIAVQRQYVPIARLMQHFTSDQESLKNEYGNISDYLLQAQQRNDHHFMTDLLLGNVPDSHSFPYGQLVLISPVDTERLIHVDEERAKALLPDCRVISVYEHTALILPKHPGEAALNAALSTLLPEGEAYRIDSVNEGQSLHHAYTEATDLLATLRFFHADAKEIYRASPSAKEQALSIMGGTFEEELRGAIFAHHESKAQNLMEGALRNMRDKCRSGNLLRGSLYAVSLLFMRLEAAVRAQNPAVPDGVSGDVVRAYRFTGMDQLTEGTAQAIHDLIAALDLQSARKTVTLYDQIDAFIRENYQNPDLNVDMIADHLNFSVVYLRRVYKQAAGKSITDEILRLRIEAAKQALAVPSSRVNDVAQQVGFLETGTFIRSFKKLEGMTPGAYKNQYQETEKSASAEGEDTL